MVDRSRRTGGPRRAWHGRFALGALAISAFAASSSLLVSCDTGDEADPTPTVAGVPAPVSIAPRADSDSFCAAIIELDGRSSEDPPVPSDVLEVYDAIAADAPEEIGADFAIVRSRLDAVVNDGAIEDDPEVDEAVERFTAWVDLVCRQTSRTPLPPPTQPGTDD